MIFATVGTQAPFERFVKILDEICADVKEEVVCQSIIKSNSYIPKNIKLIGFVAPDEYDNIFSKARLIVAHAGMGTILESLSHDKPIIIFPRMKCYGEHRNDHQLHTATRMQQMNAVHVAYDKDQLRELILTPDLPVLTHTGMQANPDLINAVKNCICK